MSNFNTPKFKKNELVRIVESGQEAAVKSIHHEGSVYWYNVADFILAEHEIEKVTQHITDESQTFKRDLGEYGC